MSQLSELDFQRLQVSENSTWYILTTKLTQLLFVGNTTGTKVQKLYTWRSIQKTEKCLRWCTSKSDCTSARAYKGSENHRKIQKVGRSSENFEWKWQPSEKTVGSRGGFQITKPDIAQWIKSCKFLIIAFCRASFV